MPSTLAVVWFLALVVIVAALFMRAARTAGDRDRASAVLLLWLVPSGILAWAGALSDFSRVPPGIMVLVGLTTACTCGLAASSFALRLSRAAGVAGLVGFQVFRAPLELLLFRLCREGVLPVQMTFQGWNYDVATGVSAAAVAYWALRGAPPRWVLWAWNLMGLALLVTIMVVAATSVPGPLRLFTNEPANRVIATFPFVWLPVFLVQAALFGHVALFRLLARGSQPATRVV